MIPAVNVNDACVSNPRRTQFLLFKVSVTHTRQDTESHLHHRTRTRNTQMHHLAAEPLPPASSSTMKPNDTHAVDRSTFFKSMAARIKASRDAIKQSGNQQNDWSRWTSDMPSPAIQDGPRPCDKLSFDAKSSSPASTSISTTVASDTTSEHTSETDVHSDANSLGADVHYDPAITYYLIGLVGNELRDRIANKLCEVEFKMRWEFDASVASSGAVDDDMDVSSLAGRQQSAHSFRRSLLRRSHVHARDSRMSCSPPRCGSLLRGSACSRALVSI